MIKYFEKSLKPSVKAKINQDTTQLDDYQELIAKAIKTEVQPSLRPSSYIQETNQNCFKENRLAHATVPKVQSQGVMKKHYDNDFKAFTPKVSTFNHDSEPFNKAKKDKKKKQQKNKRYFNNSVTRVNATKVDNKKKKTKDVNKITCYNCDKKEHYFTSCLEAQKPKNQYWSLRSSY